MTEAYLEALDAYQAALAQYKADPTPENRRIYKDALAHLNFEAGMFDASERA
jgi:hypothetical protein